MTKFGLFCCLVVASVIFGNCERTMILATDTTDVLQAIAVQVDMNKRYVHPNVCLLIKTEKNLFLFIGAKTSDAVKEGTNMLGYDMEIDTGLKLIPIIQGESSVDKITEFCKELNMSIDEFDKLAMHNDFIIKDYAMKLLNQVFLYTIDAEINDKHLVNSIAEMNEMAKNCYLLHIEGVQYPNKYLWIGPEVPADKKNKCEDIFDAFDSGYSHSGFKEKPGNESLAFHANYEMWNNKVSRAKETAEGYENTKK